VVVVVFACLVESQETRRLIAGEQFQAMEPPDLW